MGVGLLTISFVSNLLLPGFRLAFGLNPARVVPRVWTLLTCVLVEPGLLAYLTSCFTILYLSKPIEQVWGSREYAKYMALCAVISSTVLTVSAWSYALIYGTAAARLDSTYPGGFLGVTGGLLVGLKQVAPEARAVLFGVVPVTTSVVPLIAVVTLALFSFLFYLDSSPLILLTSGVIGGWVYLRFFQPIPGTALRGDQSDSFRWATMFPSVMHGACDVISAPMSPLGEYLLGPRPSVQEINQLFSGRSYSGSGTGGGGSGTGPSTSGKSGNPLLPTSTMGGGAKGVDRLEARGQSVVAAQLEGEREESGGGGGGGGTSSTPSSAVPIV